MNRAKEVENDGSRLGERMDEIGSGRPRQPQATWAATSRRIAALGDDTLVLPEFVNEFDAEWIW